MAKKQNNNNRIAIYTADASQLNSDEVFFSVYSHVSPVRQSKTDRLRFRKDKNLSLMAEYLLRCACRDFGIDYDSEEIVTGEHSKPAFGNSPMFFNLSHSGERAMCVISDAEIGCDVERMHGVNDKIAGRFFNEEEQKLLSQSESDSEREELFYTVWTLKESFMKCTGLGMALPMEDFSVTCDGRWQIACGQDISAKEGLSPEEYSLYSYGRPDGYRYAVCVRANTSEPLPLPCEEQKYRTEEGIEILLQKTLDKS